MSRLHKLRPVRSPSLPVTFIPGEPAGHTGYTGHIYGNPEWFLFKPFRIAALSGMMVSYKVILLDKMGSADKRRLRRKLDGRRSVLRLEAAVQMVRRIVV